MSFTRTKLALRPGWLLTVLVLSVACGDDERPRTPTGPTPTTNRAPTTLGSIPAQTLAPGESVAIDLAGYFEDADGDPLTYQATSSNSEIVTVRVAGSVLSVTGEDPGRTDVAVTARDPEGEAATQSFSVTVETRDDGATFSLSGTVSDRRSNGPVLSGVEVRLDAAGRSESVQTGPRGGFHFRNVSGPVTVTATAPAHYQPQTVEITVNRDRTLDIGLEHTGEPPFRGTVGITPNLLTASDPTSFIGAEEAGRGNRQMWEPFGEQWLSVNAYLFDAEYSGRTVEFQVHPDVGNLEDAWAEVETYAPVLGRLPAFLLAGAREVEVSPVDHVWQGNELGIFHIYTHRGAELLRNGSVEEVLFHEGGHVSLDRLHRNAPGWRAARRADEGVFISTYARDNSEREDVAESILPWFAVRHRPGRLRPSDRAAIGAAIPNRLAYFDDQGFDVSPYAATGG